MRDMFSLLIMLVIAAWMVTLVSGSIVALRGRRSASTILLVTGSGFMLAGGLAYFGAIMFLMSGFMSRHLTTGGGLGTWQWMLGGSMIALGLGVVLFTGGFLGLCVRYGAMERRSTELEGLVVQLQQRMQGGA